jgi:hypothetical protein
MGKMTNAKFAAVTSGLLARKGEARPWAEPDRVQSSWKPAAPGAQKAVPAKIKKSTVRMSIDDFERLGIIAVKKGTTRQHLLQEALERLLVEESRRYGAQCACLRAGKPSCDEACTG